jgi:hypothetical protein
MAKCKVCHKAEAVEQYAVCSACWREWRAKEYQHSDGLVDCEKRKRGPVPKSHPLHHRPKRGQLEVETPLGE